MTTSRLENALTVFLKVNKEENAKKAKHNKCQDKLSEFREVEAKQENAYAACEAEADEAGAAFALGEGFTPQELEQKNERRIAAAQSLEATRRMIAALTKEKAKIEGAYDPSKPHFEQAARTAVFLAAYEDERDELRKHLPLIRRAFIYHALAQGVSLRSGNTFDWDVFLRTLEFQGPGQAEISQVVSGIEAMLVGSEQAPAGSIQDRQQSNGTGIVRDQGDRK